MVNFCYSAPRSGGPAGWGADIFRCKRRIPSVTRLIRKPIPLLIIHIHEAKTPIAKLIEQAAEGAFFIIAKAGKLMIKVLALSEVEKSTAGRLSSLLAKIKTPAYFDQPVMREKRLCLPGAGLEIFAALPSCCEGWPVPRSGCLPSLD